MSSLHIADTGLFVAMGQPSNSRYQAVRRFARRNGITFVLPERVYEEPTVDDPEMEAPPLDTTHYTVAVVRAANPLANDTLLGLGIAAAVSGLRVGSVLAG